MRARLKAELLESLKSGDDQRKALLGALKEKAVWQDRLVNDLFTIIAAIGDEKVVRGLLSAVQNSRDDSLEAYRRTFIAFALEMLMPEPRLDEQWQNQIDKGFSLTEKVQNARDILIWPAVLADTLAARSLYPEVQAAVRRKAFDRLMKLDVSRSENALELVRAASPLIQSSLDQKDAAGARETADRLGQRLGERKDKLPDETLRLLLPVIDALRSQNALDDKSPLILRASADAAGSQTMAEPYRKYRSASP